MNNEQVAAAVATQYMNKGTFNLQAIEDAEERNGLNDAAGKALRKVAVQYMNKGTFNLKAIEEVTG